jgi:PncC family amidohydrolase
LKQVTASIITIGDELLIGQTIDTNSAFIAQELNKIGIWVRRRVAVGDVYDDIWQALDEEGQESDIVIITGGLGPTADDITKPLLCNYFGGKLVVNEEVLAHVNHLFKVVFRRPGPMLERNLKQAEVPDNCVVLHNARGTAPGMLFKKTIYAAVSHVQSKAPLNPPQGGTSDPDISNSYYSYSTADPIIYGLLKEFVEKHRSNPTEAEKKLWDIVRGRKMAGYKFRRQHIISNYIADFVCISEKLILEVDGLYHQLPENIISDEERTSDLNRLGFKVLRFTNEQVLNEPDSVINTIVLWLKERTSQKSETKVPPRGGFRGAIYISLPGVPHEMKGLITSQVVPYLISNFTLPSIIHRTAFTAGQGESLLAEMLKDFEPTLPPHIKLAYLPNYGMVKLRLTAKGDSKEKVEQELAPYFEKLKELVREYLVTDRDEGLEIVIGHLLKTKGKTMVTAESCTGGYIAHLITAVPGSSAYYKGSVVSYANELKENILGVKKTTLQEYGAVSAETVQEMVKGALELLQADFALATSGIMGPEGGTAEKPVGTIWIAVGNKEKVETLKLHLRFDRQRNISMTAANALNFLRKFILANS